MVLLHTMKVPNMHENLLVVLYNDSASIIYHHGVVSCLVTTYRLTKVKARMIANQNAEIIIKGAWSSWLP